MNCPSFLLVFWSVRRSVVASVFESENAFYPFFSKKNYDADQLGEALESKRNRIAIRLIGHLIGLLVYRKVSSFSACSFFSSLDK